MLERHPDGLVAISWNVDHDDPNQPPPEELQNSVLDKLRGLNITAHNVIAADPIHRVLAQYDIFGLPATLVYGKDGKLVKRFEGAFSYESDVEPLVAELLGG